MNQSVKTYEKGQVVIPSDIRKKFKIGPGSKLKIFEYDGVICLVPESKTSIQDAHGFLPKTPSLLSALLKERRRKQ